MNRNLFPILIITILTIVPQFSMADTIPPDEVDHTVSVQQTKDGGYIIISSRESLGNAQTRALIIKTDQYGEIIWTVVCSIEKNEADGSEKTTDGGLIEVGFVDCDFVDCDFVDCDVAYPNDNKQDRTNSYKTIWLRKKDAVGSVIWTRNIMECFCTSRYISLESQGLASLQ